MSNLLNHHPQAHRDADRWALHIHWPAHLELSCHHLQDLALRLACYLLAVHHHSLQTHHHHCLPALYYHIIGVIMHWCSMHQGCFNIKGSPDAS